MDTAVLEARLQELETQFTSLNQQKAEHDKKSSDIEAELFRLQGDFRTIQALLRDNEPITGEVVTDPLTIKAEEDTTEDATSDEPE